MEGKNICFVMILSEVKTTSLSLQNTNIYFFYFYDEVMTKSNLLGVVMTKSYDEKSERKYDERYIH